MSLQPLVILLAEDDDGHADLVQINLRRVGVVNTIVHVRDGQEALEYVRRQGINACRQPSGPLLMILDINMPRVDGIEVLQTMKADERTARIPVIVLTTTDDPREIERCYERGCSLYITKPVEYDAFVDAIRRLGLLLEIVHAPSEAG